MGKFFLCCDQDQLPSCQTSHKKLITMDACSNFSTPKPQVTLVLSIIHWTPTWHSCCALPPILLVARLSQANSRVLFVIYIPSKVCFYLLGLPIWLFNLVLVSLCNASFLGSLGSIVTHSHNAHFPLQNRTGTLGIVTELLDETQGGTESLGYICPKTCLFLTRHSLLF